MTPPPRPTKKSIKRRSNRSRVEAIAALGEADFQRARTAIRDFAKSLDYEDWLDDRFGLTVGLCSSGVDARIVTVDLSSFLAFCRSARLAPTEKNLHLFAGVIASLRERGIGEAEATTLASVSEADFARYFERVDAFRSAGDHGRWMTQREDSARAAQAAGKTVFQTPTPIADFLEWTRCLGQPSSETFLDRYAALTLEALIGA